MVRDMRPEGLAEWLAVWLWVRLGENQETVGLQWLQWLQWGYSGCGARDGGFFPSSGSGGCADQTHGVDEPGWYSLRIRGYFYSAVFQPAMAFGPATFLRPVKIETGEMLIETKAGQSSDWCTDGIIFQPFLFLLKRMIY